MTPKIVSDYWKNQQYGRVFRLVLGQLIKHTKYAFFSKWQ